MNDSTNSKMLRRLDALRAAISERNWSNVEFHFANVTRGVERLVQAWHDGDNVVFEDEAWSPMERAGKVLLSKEKEAILIANGGDQALIDDLNDSEVWKNELYTVSVSRAPEGWVQELSIRRNDRKAVHDWRHFQRIKTEIAGPDVEAVEMYPDERRLMDTANQYYLFCLPPGMWIPFGYTGARNLADAGDQQYDGAQQRPLPPDWASTWDERLAEIRKQREEADQP